MNASFYPCCRCNYKISALIPAHSQHKKARFPQREKRAFSFKKPFCKFCDKAYSSAKYLMVRTIWLV